MGCAMTYVLTLTRRSIKGLEFQSMRENVVLLGVYGPNMVVREGFADFVGWRRGGGTYCTYCLCVYIYMYVSVSLSVSPHICIHT